MRSAALFAVVILLSLAGYARPGRCDPGDGLIQEYVDLDEILSDISPRLTLLNAGIDDLAAAPAFTGEVAGRVIALRDSAHVVTTDAIAGLMPELTPLQRIVLEELEAHGGGSPGMPFSGGIRTGWSSDLDDAPDDGRYYARLRSDLGSQAEVTLIGERDPGEPRGLDLVSGAFALRSGNGREMLVLGDYRPDIGQRLVFSRYSRSYADAVRAGVHTAATVANTLFEESRYLRGVWGGGRWGGTTVSAWGSVRHLDALIGGDGAEIVRTTGIHTGQEGRGALDERLAGAGIETSIFSGAAVGLAGAVAWYDPRLAGRPGERTVLDPTGSRFGWITAYGGWMAGGVEVFFEHARMTSGPAATLAGGSVRVTDAEFTVAARRYGTEYWSLRSAGMSSFGETGNEEGMYAAADIRFPLEVRAVVSVDLARRLSRGYTDDMPVSRRRLDAVVRMPVARGYDLAWGGRLVDDSIPGKRRGSVHAELSESAAWRWRTRAAWSSGKGDGGPYLGFTARLDRRNYGVVLEVAGFSIPSYDARYYRYEYQVPGRGMTRPVWGTGGSVGVRVGIGPLTAALHYAESDLMAADTDLTVQLDAMF